MQFRDSPEESAFRMEVREFITGHLPANIKSLSPNRDLREEQKVAFGGWKKALSQRGWFAPHWPKQYGGAGMSVVEHFVFNEEMAEARAPQVGGMGVQMIGPILIRFGNEEQQKEHLPRITSGEVTWCQGYSEPGAGSDLATIARGMRDRARSDREPVRNHIAERMVEASVARLISYRVIDIQRRGGIPNYEASMNKLYGSEVGQRVAATGIELLGLYGGLMEGSKYGEAGRIPLSYLATVASTIAAGTSEVNRSVIATRGLGLPRS